LIMMAGGVSLYYVANQGFFPVAIVNSKLISAKTLNQEYAAAFKYYSAVLDTYSGKNSETDFLESRKEIKRAVLDKIIEDTLVYGELKRAVGKDLAAIVDNKIGDKSEGQNLKEAALTLYGLDAGDFRKLVLAPQARREILAGRLYLEKKDFNQWLAAARVNARVIILSPGFEWKDGKVESKSYKL